MSLKDDLCLVYFYVPEEHAEKVTQALFAAGAGRIGDYDSCAWSVEGRGQFRPLEKANPFTGTKGTLGKEAELKVEVVCPRSSLEQVLTALVLSHPYEEPAYGAIPVMTLAEKPARTAPVEHNPAPVPTPIQDTGPSQTAADLEFYRNALLYQELHADFTQDVDFYCRLLSKVKGPILELGAGNARVGRGLARAGHEVWALDLVDEILKLGFTEALAEGLTLRTVKADMRNFEVKDHAGNSVRFAAIICPLNTLAHLLSPGDLVSCLDSIRRHLLPGGIFVPSLFVPDPAFLYRDPEALRFVDSFESKSRGCMVELYEKNTFNPLSQINHLTWFFQPDEGDEVIEESYRLRVWHPQEFFHVCKTAGFFLQEVWADYAIRGETADPASLPPDTIMQTLVLKPSVPA